MTISEEAQLVRAVALAAGKLLQAETTSARHIARLELGRAMSELRERAELSANPHFTPLAGERAIG